ncbi:MAG TPA: ArsR family transcriptional regulator [Porticoccaceae bacterium]|jgi:ubiquinone/menaquinone biosynthesis C-methylase UbiE/DNA-binding transcriptional ArsR family regulator|nr:ArsR family transcriptional regulator [Porticoccaceae bacterium]
MIVHDKMLRMSLAITPTPEHYYAHSADAATALCKAAGDSLRMQILKVLQQNAYGVLELCAVFGIQQPAMSHHLKILASASLVATRREGTSIFYRRHELTAEDPLFDLQNSLFQTIDSINLDQNYTDKLSSINANRCAASVAFFNQNVNRFEENQDLIASWSDYGESVIGFIPKQMSNKHSALEVGAGYGQFLVALALEFNQVTALDNSKEMLEQCVTRVSAQKIKNVEFCFGNTQKIIEFGNKFDFISLNMVLHHNPSPADIIQDCAQLLHSQGMLMITELCAHDQEWTKQSCGDLWLGFEPAFLSRWTASAGLIEGNSLYLTQRNGFRIQLRQFHKN